MCVGGWWSLGGSQEGWFSAVIICIINYGYFFNPVCLFVIKLKCLCFCVLILLLLSTVTEYCECDVVYVTLLATYLISLMR